MYEFKGGSCADLKRIEAAYHSRRYRIQPQCTQSDLLCLKPAVGNQMIHSSPIREKNLSVLGRLSSARSPSRSGCVQGTPSARKHSTAQSSCPSSGERPCVDIKASVHAIVVDNL